jgi:hypothetical protein
MDAEIEAFHAELIACVVRYGGTDEVTARVLVDESAMCRVSDEDDRAALMHETPYYWAMSLLHARTNPQWFHDRALWPPPADYEAWADRFQAERRIEG